MLHSPSLSPRLTRAGSRVLHQVPDGSVTPSTAPCAQSAPYFSFSDVSDYVIPRQEFCDRLVTVCSNHYRIIGYPVCINNYNGKYDRNQFIFNFAFVVEEDLLDWNSYASVVRKLGKLLRNLEEQGSFLSKEEKDIPWDALGDPGKTSAAYVGLGIKRVERAASIAESVGEDQSVRSLGLDGLSLDIDAAEIGINSKVYALCEMILEDLNNYCECMIPIGGFPPRISAFAVLQFLLTRITRRFKHHKSEVVPDPVTSGACSRVACSSVDHRPRDVYGPVCHEPTFIQQSLRYSILRSHSYAYPPVH